MRWCASVWSFACLVGLFAWLGAALTQVHAQHNAGEREPTPDSESKAVPDSESRPPPEREPVGAGEHASELVGSAGGSASPSEAALVSEGELRARLVALRRIEPLDDSVRRPLELAQSALARSRQRASAGDADAAARAEQIARVAVELAEARLHLLRERALERGSLARLRTAEVSAKRSEQALARERKRARELAQASATP